MAWKDSLPAELKDDASLKDFKDDDKEGLTALARSFVDTKKFVGSSIRPPGPDAGPEARKGFLEKLRTLAPELMPTPDEKDEEGAKLVWQKLGRPEKPEEYEFKAPEGVELDLAALRATATAAGMTKKQFAKLAELNVADTVKQTAALKADQTALKTEWGQAYEPKLKAAAAAAAKLNVSENVIKAIQAGNLTSVQLKLWDGIAKALGAEGSDIARQGKGAPATVMTPKEAELQIGEIRSRKDKAYWDNNHPEHKGLVDKVHELMKFVVPLDQQ